MQHQQNPCISILHDNASQMEGFSMKCHDFDVESSGIIIVIAIMIAIVMEFKFGIQNGGFWLGLFQHVTTRMCGQYHRGDYQQCCESQGQRQQN